MYYSWKDVRNSFIFATVCGIVLVIFVMVLVTIMHEEEDLMPFHNTAHVYLFMGGLSFWMYMQLYAWRSGVTAHTHGWALKTIDVIGINVGFLWPFMLAYLVL